MSTRAQVIVQATQLMETLDKLLDERDAALDRIDTLEQQRETAESVEQAARELLAVHFRVLASGGNITDWRAYIRQVADAHEAGIAWLHKKSVQKMVDTVLSANSTADGPSLDDTDATLLWVLRRAGEEWGPTGVARVAARLASAPAPDPQPIFTTHPTDPAQTPDDLAAIMARHDNHGITSGGDCIETLRPDRLRCLPYRLAERANRVERQYVETMGGLSSAAQRVLAAEHERDDFQREAADAEQKGLIQGLTEALDLVRRHGDKAEMKILQRIEKEKEQQANRA